MRLYSMPSSGNSYKVRLLLALLGRTAEVVDCEYGSAELAQARAVLPFGKVPALLLDDGQVLAESDAILWFLGEGTGFVPADPVARAQMLAWMFWEQYSHEPYVAVARFQVRYAGKPVSELEPRLVERGKGALQRLEDGLALSPFLVGEAVSLADVALVAYTRVAHEGGFDLGDYPAVAAWVKRVEAALKIT